MQTTTKQILIIGCGPAGIMAAITAAKTGANVTVLEQMPKPALKLLASGGGHCNITNTLTIEQFYPKFGKQGRFIKPALHNLDNQKLREFLNQIKIPTITTDNFHYFPKCNSAATLLQALLNQFHKLKIKLITNSKATKLIIQNQQITAVQTKDKTFPADSIILACGGKGYPQLGGSENGYNLAKQAQHQIITPLPALVGLKTKETWTHNNSGITFKNITAQINLPKYKKQTYRGDLLLTHHGISGPAIINLSGQISRILHTNPTPVPIIISLFPHITQQNWQNIFNTWRQKQGNKQLNKLLTQYLPKTIITEFTNICQIPAKTTAAQLTKNTTTKLIAQLQTTPLTITTNQGFKKAMVTTGGVDLKQINPKTLQSKIYPNLFIIGELLNLDGPCGGFNLQWAFASGSLAGKYATSTKQQNQIQNKTL